MILVTAAMKSEISAVASAAERNELGNVRVGTIGVGKVMAAMNTQRLLMEQRPSAALMLGVAGGLNPELGIGDVIVGESCIQHDLDTTALNFPRGTVPFTDYQWIDGDPQLLAKARSLEFSGTNYAGEPVRLCIGRILTGDQFMTRAMQQQNRFLRTELKGDAIDMESAAFALVCAANRIPHLVVRVISDTADGKAKVDFGAFLPQAGARILEIAQQLLL
ncbi:5'-methylthioadenosine/S-adenosylhomocysteine nucleosidase [Spirochaeta dissipatitropha]